MDDLMAMAFQLNPAMMLIFSPESGRIVDINQSCADKIGLPPAEIAGSSFQEFADWGESNGFHALMDRLRRERKILAYETHCHSANGEEWSARISASLMTSGTETVAIATIEDITEHQALEEKIHRSEEFYRLLVNCAGDVIWVMDLSGRFIFISPSSFYQYGYKPEELIQQSFEPLLMPASAARTRDTLEKIAEQVQAGLRVECRRVELELVHKRGSTFWSEVNFCGMYTSKGEFVGLQGISRDISDRKKAEQAASENLQMLNDLAQNIPGAAFQFYHRRDGSRGFHYLSARAYEMFDLPQDWRLGINVHPKDHPRLLASVAKAIKTAAPWSFEGRFLLKTGEVRWFHGLAQPMQKENELIFNGVLLDVTQRKLAEMALSEEYRRKDEFMMMLAHELRNPLAPIRNTVEMMKLAREEEATHIRHLGLIEHQIGHMARLIDDLLDIARITHGMISLQKEKIVLNDVVEQAIETSMIDAGPRMNDFTCLMPKEKIIVHADFTRLVQAICNLLVNARKFSQAGQQIRLSVLLDDSATPDRQPEAVICVEDQGMGIDPEVLPHIFEIFVQGDKSLARTSGGLGIGLSLARRIAELHGGSITASSLGPGKGSQFCMRFPALLNQDIASQMSDSARGKA